MDDNGDDTYVREVYRRTQKRVYSRNVSVGGSGKINVNIERNGVVRDTRCIEIKRDVVNRGRLYDVDEMNRQTT